MSDWNDRYDFATFNDPARRNDRAGPVLAALFGALPVFVQP
ncbi:hypothetical protein MPL3365_210006 [Mesorhizobium plurifarium]|uniref:Uncharacterized protein n=1 Tax=Mesorhizobium plurifarium TaxID=69974 RepID=A0A090G3Q1_MESPL|nr:hypothetical protein MPL3365_210006 [Mesorhizobium plurifarium]